MEGSAETLSLRRRCVRTTQERGMPAPVICTRVRAAHGLNESLIKDHGTKATENFVLNNVALLRRNTSGFMFVDHVVSRNADLISELSTTADASLAIYIGGNEVPLTRETLIPVVGLQYNEIAVRITFNEKPPPEWTLSYACTDLARKKRQELQRATAIVAPTFKCASGCLLVSSLVPPRSSGEA